MHLRLIGKLVVEFLLVIIELFFARCFRFVTIHAFDRPINRQMLIGRPQLHSCNAVKPIEELLVQLTYFLRLQRECYYYVTVNALNVNISVCVTNAKLLFLHAFKVC